MKRTVIQSYGTNVWNEKHDVIIMKWSHRIQFLGTTFSVEETITKNINDLNPEFINQMDENMTARIEKRVKELKKYLSVLEELGFNKRGD